MSVDIETYSSVNLTKSGVYKYCEAPDFTVLLCACAIDDGPVYVADLVSQQDGYLWNSIREMLVDPRYIKHAYNAAFEITCLSRFMGVQLDAAQWRCTQMHGLYCGFTAGLAATGAAVGIDEDKKKLATGKALIKYFCTPPRHMPSQDPAKWELFKEYCAQDVEAERAIEKRLSVFPVPDFVQKQWVTDYIINSRGVGVDMAMVRGAIDVGEGVKTRLFDEAVELSTKTEVVDGVTYTSQLANPNSPKQLMEWLEEEIDEDVPDLKKETVSEMLVKGLSSEKAKRMLEIRQEMSKTSVKKYDAIVECACSDDRVRGLLQFYGANRTGRWAGRLVQMQNLPRTHLPMLDLARELTSRKHTDGLKIVYGSVPDTLSQLIRTVFTGAFIDADFSAIEARVISWLAGEQWRLDVFKTHGKIYEASASQMFGVPIEKIKKGEPEYDLRARGKVAELALGFQGGTAALIRMGALNMGLTEAELPEIVQRWRNSNGRIRNLWYAIENAAIQTIKTGASTGVNGLIFAKECNDRYFLTIRLPSGRKLYYADPRLGVNQWGKASITYKGLNQTTKKWETTETYGGCLTENCVQAIARDCLAEGIERLEAAGYPVVTHIHDEVVIDLSLNGESGTLEDVIKIMSAPMPWAPDLPLAADGWTGAYFRKE